MKRKITLVTLMFMFTFFALAQKADMETNEKLLKIKLERQIKGVRQDDIGIRKDHLFPKNLNFNQNPALKLTLENKQKLDSTHALNWSAAGNQWVNRWKDKFTYNTSGNMTQLRNFTWDATTSQWTTGLTIEYTYDANGNIIQYLHDNYEKFEYAYDANGNMIQKIFYDWDEYNIQWLAKDKEEYTYDAEEKLIQGLFYDWVAYGSEWDIDKKSEYTYDASEKMIQIIYYEWDGINSHWTNYRKTEYTYDANGNIILEFHSSWKEADNEWKGYRKTEYAYDTIGNMTQEIVYTWGMYATQWEGIRNDEYIFDESNNIIQTFSYSWDGNSWIVSGHKGEYTYNNSYGSSELIIPRLSYNSFEYFFISRGIDIINFFNHMLTSVKTYYGENTVSKIDFYYSEYTQSIPEINDGKLIVYPNPVSDYVLFNISGFNSKITLELIDMQGRKVMIREISNNEKVSMEGIKKGMYLYRLILDEKELNGKLIKE